MRNFVIDTSRGLAAAGVFLAAVVTLTGSSEILVEVAEYSAAALGFAVVFMLLVKPHSETRRLQRLKEHAV